MIIIILTAPGLGGTYSDAGQVQTARPCTAYARRSIAGARWSPGSANDSRVFEAWESADWQKGREAVVSAAPRVQGPESGAERRSGPGPARERR
jgi:hypothetical protein